MISLKYKLFTKNTTEEKDITISEVDGNTLDM